MIYVYMAAIGCVIALLGIFALAIDEALKGGNGAEAMTLFEKGALILLTFILVFVLVCVLLGPVPIYD